METSNFQFENKIKNNQLPIDDIVVSLSLPNSQAHSQALFYRSVKITPWNRGTSTEKKEI